MAAGSRWIVSALAPNQYVVLQPNYQGMRRNLSGRVGTTWTHRVRREPCLASGTETIEDRKVDPAKADCEDANAAIKTIVSRHGGSPVRARPVSVLSSIRQPSDRTSCRDLE